MKNNEVSKQLTSLNFEQSNDSQYEINRTFRKGNFITIRIVDTTTKIAKILIYKNITLAKIRSDINNLNDKYNDLLIANFADNEEGWELASYCCKKLYTDQKEIEKKSYSNGYSNGIMLSPEGVMMCRCGKDRIKWYLKKGLATLENEDPMTIKLNFKPKACGKKDDPYYLQEIKNQCVVCGSQDNLSKHHVIPYCFRKFLPKNIKENTSHDILLLCQEHHRIYEKEADKLKKSLSKKYNCAIIGKNFTIDLKLKKVKEAAIELCKKRKKLTANRRKKLNNIIQKHYKTKKIFNEDLQSAIKINYKTKGKDFVEFGKYIIDSVESIDEFMIMWRQHFIDLMNPKFLPEFWDINKEIITNIKEIDNDSIET